jgi:hypothetical protein
MTLPPPETALLSREAARAAAIAHPSPRRIAIGVAIIIALMLPLFMTSFIIFQLTLVMIYGLAILGLNLLTGFNGQFSLGHSARPDEPNISPIWTLLRISVLACRVSFQAAGIAAARAVWRSLPLQPPRR